MAKNHPLLVQETAKKFDPSLRPCPVLCGLPKNRHHRCMAADDPGSAPAQEAPARDSSMSVALQRFHGFREPLGCVKLHRQPQASLGREGELVQVEVHTFHSK